MKINDCKYIYDTYNGLKIITNIVENPEDYVGYDIETDDGNEESYQLCEEKENVVVVILDSFYKFDGVYLLSDTKEKILNYIKKQFGGLIMPRFENLKDINDQDMWKAANKAMSIIEYEIKKCEDRLDKCTNEDEKNEIITDIANWKKQYYSAWNYRDRV